MMTTVLSVSDRTDHILNIKKKKDESVPCRAKVLGRADKATVKYKNWHNLQFIYTDVSHGQKEAVDLSRIESEVRDADVLKTKDV